MSQDHFIGGKSFVRCSDVHGNELGVWMYDNDIWIEPISKVYSRLDRPRIESLVARLNNWLDHQHFEDPS